MQNWFQNRRAKAKQQRRQEEFEKMQREKKEAEEAAQSKSEGASQPPQSSQPKPSNESTKPSTTNEKPAVKAEGNKKQPAGSSRPKHQKTRSESAREATFASLQRALNAAVANREQYGPGDPNDSDASVSPTTVIPPGNNNTGTANDGTNEHAMFTHSFSDLKTGNDSSIQWTSQPPRDAFGYGSLNTTLTRADDPRGAYQLDITSHHGPSDEVPPESVPFQPPEEWANQMPASQPFPSHRAASDAGASYNTLQYASLQPPEVSLSRRGSSDQLANTLEGVGAQAASRHLHPPQPEGTSAPAKETGKEVDIAARRKRPRPAAIGTTGSGRPLTGSSTMSPTARVTSVNSGVRQSKSAQSLNSRYAGVRKASAAQRSPLKLSTFTDPASLNSTKAEMSSMLQPSVSTSSLAPPTPITPETLHHLLPTSPSDGGYCLSAQPTTTQFFPASQPMPINVASPPATPLPMDMMSQFPYPNMAPPMSAPAIHTTFSDFGACDIPLTAKTWGDSAPVPSPDMVFQDSCQIPQGDISPIEFDPAVEGCQSADTIPSPMVFPASQPGMSTGETRANDFEIHEFPGQHEAHRYVAQQLPSQARKNYVFANKTPMAFGGVTAS